jgi:hypothetical protein
LGGIVDIGAFEVPFTLIDWREQNSLAANGSQDLASSVGDGVSKLLKYAFNMTGSLSMPHVSILSAAGSSGLPLIRRNVSGFLEVTYIRRKSTNIPGITFNVEFGGNLTNWSSSTDETTVTSINSTLERVTVTDTSNSSKCFGRVTVIVPLDSDKNPCFRQGCPFFVMRIDLLFSNLQEVSESH